LPYISLAREHGISKTGTSFMQYLKRGTKYFWAMIRLKLTRIK